MLTAPTLPFGARLMNAALAPVAKRLHAMDLREERLLEEARRATGLADFGDDGYRVGLRRALEALESEARLTPIGRSIARANLLPALVNRLGLRGWRRRHPEIAAERVERPIVILGMGRTGTTILHELMAQDPRNRVPLAWEAGTPCPPPERASYGSDPRIAATDAQLDQTEQLIPDFKKMHEMGAQLPQECVMILNNDFVSMQLELSFRIPSYSRWLHEEADLAPAYRNHRATLQHLQWRCPGRWVLKSPVHLWHIEALLAEYPDAVLIQTHRDPLRVHASLTSLATTLRAMSSNGVDPLEVSREWSHLHAIAYEKAVDARESGLVRPDQVLDVQFREFMSDPFATLRRIYDFAGLDYTPDTDARMHAYLDANPAGKHGVHEYTFADTGLDEAEERSKVKRYMEYFGVAEERV